LAESIAFERNDEDPESGSWVDVVDDGRVCYAYFLSPAREIVGDLWLYNRCETPADPEWTNREGAPYANPQGYVGDTRGGGMPGERRWPISSSAAS